MNMKSSNKLIHRHLRNIALIIGFVGMILVFGIDTLKPYALEEDLPIFTEEYLLQSILIFISLLLLFGYIKSIGDDNQVIIFSVENKNSINNIFTFIGYFLSLFFLLIFIFKPSAFSKLSLEDGIVEWGTAVLFFLSSIVFFMSFLKNFRHKNKSILFMLCFFCLIFFVMAGEEISWFQRVFNIETPDSFKNNIQSEMNFHNFATDRLELMFYFGSFLFLVVMPFLKIKIPYIKKNDFLSYFWPGTFIVVTGAIPCAYNFDMWNISFIQISFCGAVVILFYLSTLNKDSQDKLFLYLTTILVSLTQILFLWKGDAFSRIWEVTEYKEFFISLSFFIYALSVYRKGKIYK